MTPFTYIIGQPGAGKTTLVRALTDGLHKQAVTWPVAHIVYPDVSAIQLGADRDDFGGTDALGMSVQPKALDFLDWAQSNWHGAFAEGDRLANGKFFEAVIALGYELEVIHLDASDELAAARRAARGSTQNEGWVKGRVTKTRRLAEEYADRTVTVPADYADAPAAVDGTQLARILCGATLAR